MTLAELTNRKNVLFLQLELMRQEEKALVKQFGRKGYERRIDMALDALLDIKKRILKLIKNEKDDESKL